MRRLAYLVLAVLLLVAVIGPWQTFTGAFTDWSRARFIEQLLMLRPTLDNFKRLFVPPAGVDPLSGGLVSLFPTWWRNSLVIATLTACLQSVLSVVAGYALARHKFPGKGALLALTVLRHIVPVSALFIPLYIVIRRLGLSGLWGMVLPYAVSASTIIMSRQFALGLAGEVFEAASIDGADDWQVLRYVAAPMLMPVVGMTFAQAFTQAWGNLLWANMMFRSVQGWTTGQGILYILRLSSTSDGHTDYGLLSAAAVCSLAVPVLVFIVLQKPTREAMEGMIRE